MTVLAVIAYPDLEHVARGWIESVRAEYDPQASRVAAHFTLVFPTRTEATLVAQEVVQIAEDAEPIFFAIAGAMVVPDSIGSGGHVFLVPGEGSDAIRHLHHRLYESALRPHLREEIAFVPHMTVASGADLAWCQQLAAELDVQSRSVTGLLRAIELVDTTPHRVKSIDTFALGTISL